MLSRSRAGNPGSLTTVRAFKRTLFYYYYYHYYHYSVSVLTITRGRTIRVRTVTRRFSCFTSRLSFYCEKVLLFVCIKLSRAGERRKVCVCHRSWKTADPPLLFPDERREGCAVFFFYGGGVLLFLWSRERARCGPTLEDFL